MNSQEIIGDFAVLPGPDSDQHLVIHGIPDPNQVKFRRSIPHSSTTIYIYRQACVINLLH